VKPLENVLKSCSSLYLQQHANDPVAWQPWSERVFDMAKERNCLVFLSIGFASCHWCHQMGRHCFQDSKIAQLLNEHFIAVKVDREERPDLDAKYGKFIESIHSKRGWPMSVFLDSSKTPLFGDFYMSADQFQILLSEIIESPEKVVEKYQKKKSGEASKEIDEKSASPGEFDLKKTLFTVINQLSFSYDSQYGGFHESGGAKFPHACTLNALLDLSVYYVDASSGKVDDSVNYYLAGVAVDIVTSTLRNMCSRGIFDHVGGGFHRYTEDTEWSVPHFEKMLNDQALLLNLYLDAYTQTGDLLFAYVARKIISYCLETLKQDNQPLFYSAQSAESKDANSGEMVEGDYYFWSREHVASSLDETKAKTFEELFSASGKCLHLRNQLFSEQDIQQLDLLTGELKSFRNRTRPHPERDEKFILSWNALMVSSLIKASAVFENNRYLEIAISAMNEIKSTLFDGKTLYHCVGVDGFCIDFACTIQSSLDLFEMLGDSTWLQFAIELQTIQNKKFWKDEFFSPSEISRDDPLDWDYFRDRAEPSFLSVSVKNLNRIYAICHDPIHKSMADQLFASFRKSIVQQRGYFSKCCQALLQFSNSSVDVCRFVISGNYNPADAHKLWLNSLFKERLPSKAVIQIPSTEHLSRLKLHLFASEVEYYDSYLLSDGPGPVVFFCRGSMCLAPAKKMPALRKALDSSAAQGKMRDLKPSDNIWSLLKRNDLEFLVKILDSLKVSNVTADSTVFCLFHALILCLKAFKQKMASLHCFGFVRLLETSMWLMHC
jgi:uncharacterized protein YyaL (SSP411 family)